MSINDSFILYTPFFFVILSLILLYWLYRIYKITKSWILEMIMIIPSSIAILYTWIGFWNPAIEKARLGFRFVVAFALGIGIHIAYTHAKSLFSKKGGTE